MFDSKGKARTWQNHELKNILKAEMNASSCASPDSVVVDCCGLLWHVEYPKNGTVSNFVNNFINKVSRFLQTSSVFLIFDKYWDYSAKSSTRCNRSDNQSSREYHVTLETPIPTISALLGNYKNKVQLIDLICSQLRAHFLNNPKSPRLFVTWAESISIEITNGKDLLCHESTYEKADVIIISQVKFASELGHSSCHVLCEDTDVLILLLNFHEHQFVFSCQIFMAAFNLNPKIMSLKETVTNNSASCHQYYLHMHYLGVLQSLLIQASVKTQN